MPKDTCDKIGISLGVCVAGGRVVAACLADPGLLSKANAAGEIASRVYQAMVLQARAEAATLEPEQFMSASEVAGLPPVCCTATQAGK